MFRLSIPVLSALVWVAVATASADEAKAHKLSVLFKVPDTSYKAAISEVRQVGKELWVRVDVKSSGFGASVITNAKAEATVKAPDLPVKYIVFGKKWGWKNTEKGITFLADQGKEVQAYLKKKFETGKLVYSAGKGGKDGK
jgi:hypothetical protein